MNLKIQTETQWLQEANNNLEQARAEKELADIAVEEIISSSTSALPFSIVPNGNGFTNPGAPFGNNPAGSPLGPVANRDEVDPSRQVVIGDLSSYLSRAYQAGVDPARPSTVSTLYPLSVSTLETLVQQSTVGVFNPDRTFVAPAGGVGNFACGSTGALDPNAYFGQGTIYSVQPGLIRVRGNNGQMYSLRVGGCSNLEATQQNHVLGLQDTVYFRGVPAQGGYNLHSLTCVV